MRLIDKLTHIRSQAAILFDLGRKRGMTGEEIRESIEPLMHRLDDEVNNAMIGDKALAVKVLEHQNEAFGLDLEFIQQKIEDNNSHIAMIKASLLNDIKKRDKISVSENGYSVSIVDNELHIR